MAKLLLAHGANENLQRLSTISYRRPGWTRATTVFTRGTNDFNRYSLLELLAALWGPGWPQPSLQFPDLEKITIDRLDPATSRSSEVHVSSDYLADCSKDFPLEWGDQISVPEVDHALNESWFLPRPDRDFLTKCLTRHVQIIVKQETNTVRLVPELVQPGPPRASARGFTPEEPKPGEEKTVSTFLLKGVIYGAHVLRASSDIRRVRVRRLDPSTKRTREWTLDLTPLEGGASPGLPGQVRTGAASEPDLWLRDGDVIEIPEKR